MYFLTISLNYIVKYFLVLLVYFLGTPITAFLKQDSLTKIVNFSHILALCDKINIICSNIKSGIFTDLSSLQTRKKCRSRGESLL